MAISPMMKSPARCTTSGDVEAAMNYRELEGLEHDFFCINAVTLCPASGRFAYGCDKTHVGLNNCVHIASAFRSVSQ